MARKKIKLDEKVVTALTSIPPSVFSTVQYRDCLDQKKYRGPGGLKNSSDAAPSEVNAVSAINSGPNMFKCVDRKIVHKYITSFELK